ncbi:MAG: hypothetical protein PCFJNLEI_04229 [Verrucomicrobiae bacterium]|nr:hypothetical protein [Verrucomicrobiae bacterium]
MPPLRRITLLLNAPAILATRSRPPLLIVFVLLPKPNATVGVNVAPLLMMRLARPSALLWLVTMVMPSRTSTVPPKLLLLPRMVSVPVPVPVELVSVRVLPAVMLTLVKVACSVPAPVLENETAALVEMVTSLKRYRSVFPTLPAKVSAASDVEKSRLLYVIVGSTEATTEVIVELLNTWSAPPMKRVVLEVLIWRSAPPSSRTTDPDSAPDTVLTLNTPPLLIVFVRPAA